VNKNLIERAIADLLEALGLDLNDANFHETPKRVAKLYADELCVGVTPYLSQHVEALMSKTFPTTSTDMVTIRGHQCTGLCPHHLLPVLYEAHVGYIPKGHAVGLSKLPRLISLLAARPMLQEDLGNAVLAAVNQHLSADAIVVLKGQHTCMSIRGVRSHRADTVTSAVSGVFAKEPHAKAEFLELLRL
jgi:GTP cyclohydrolase I